MEMKEQLSALLDSELEARATETVLHGLADRDLFEAAELYLLIGDVLREKNAFVTPSRNLAVAISKCLESESYLSVDLDEADHISKPRRLTIQV